MVLVLFDPDRFSGQVGRALKNSGFTKNRHWKVQNIVCYVILGVQASVMQMLYYCPFSNWRIDFHIPFIDSPATYLMEHLQNFQTFPYSLLNVHILQN